MNDPAPATRAAEAAARSSYGRLLALLVARTRDIAAAEDALADAFLAALRHWPTQGVPANPDAWLLTAARNRLRNEARHRAVADTAHQHLAVLSDEAQQSDDELPDERLKLLFVCAHPAIDPAIRTPLMLQTVLGLDAAQIGAAFLVPATTMGQRLVRAKTKIRDAGLRIEVPARDEMPERLGDVLEAIYAAYGASWDEVAGAERGRRDFAAESLFLSRLLVELLPAEPEAKGLLSLILFCESRRDARRDEAGRFVPLLRQELRRWSHAMVAEAERWLSDASSVRVFGRFQCEAAIQSVHAQTAITGATNHDALAMLYRLLIARCPSIGAFVGWAAAQLEVGRGSDALATLDQLDVEQVVAYQPYWVVRARALRAVGDAAAAQAALDRALALTVDPQLAEFLRSS